jgi:hypothetical protein
MVRDLFKLEDHATILNAEETAWRLSPAVIMTWAKEGVEPLNLRFNGNIKNLVTVMATVTISFRRSPLIILTKGQTNIVEAMQLGNTG